MIKKQSLFKTVWYVHIWNIVFKHEIHIVKRGIEISERVQRRATKIIRGYQILIYEERHRNCRLHGYSREQERSNRGLQDIGLQSGSSI